MFVRVRVLFVCREMGAAAEGLGLEWIAQVHSEAELQTAIDADCKIFGICNRNQDTQEVISPVDFVLRDWAIPIQETIFNLGEKVHPLLDRNGCRPCVPAASLGEAL